MSAALNACGYDEGLTESDPIRQKLRDQVANDVELASVRATVEARAPHLLAPLKAIEAAVGVGR